MRYSLVSQVLVDFKLELATLIKVMRELEKHHGLFSQFCDMTMHSNTDIIDRVNEKMRGRVVLAEVFR
jgi:hypothetical protein